MPRTTVDIDASVLAELKRRQKQENKTLGQLVSELLARSLAAPGEQGQVEPIVWVSRPMGALVELDDKEAVGAAMGHL